VSSEISAHVYFGFLNLSLWTLYNKFSNGSVTHNSRWLVVLRVALGVALFVKGISFIVNSILIDQLMSGSILSNRADWLPLVITWAHLIGGFMIIIGLFPGGPFCCKYQYS
jgi:hypothetical protein